MALRGHRGPVWAVVFSPDGARQVSSRRPRISLLRHLAHHDRVESCGCLTPGGAPGPRGPTVRCGATVATSGWVRPSSSGTSRPASNAGGRRCHRAALSVAFSSPRRSAHLVVAAERVSVHPRTPPTATWSLRLLRSRRAWRRTRRLDSNHDQLHRHGGRRRHGADLGRQHRQHCSRCSGATPTGACARRRGSTDDASRVLVTSSEDATVRSPAVRHLPARGRPHRPGRARAHPFVPARRRGVRSARRGLIAA